MPVFNYPKKEVNVKVVYYGPGLSGKTTNLQKIHDGIKPEFRGKLVSLATQTDRTLFFDFMPMELGSLGGYKVRLHLYTVPGQVHYNATRKLVLKGVDGIVFVADSQKAMNDANIESVLNLEKNLQSYGKSLDEIPHVIQANKRDLGEVIKMEEITSMLNHHGAVVTEAVASEGKGVMETLTEIVRLVMTGLRDQFAAGLQSTPAPPPDQAPEPEVKPEPATGSSFPTVSPSRPVAGATDTEIEAGVDEKHSSLVDGEDDTRMQDDEDADREVFFEESVDQPGSDHEFGSSLAGDSPSAGSGSDRPEDMSGSAPAPGSTVKVLVPVEEIGTLELSINISARILEGGVLKAVGIDVSGAALANIRTDPAPPSPSDTAEAVPEGKSPEKGPEPGPNHARREVGAVVPEPEYYAESAAVREVPGGPPSEDKELAPLGETSGEPLGMPLDGQDDDLHIPDLPQEEKKILDEDPAIASPGPSSPEPISGYDPTVQALDFDFPETELENEEPRRKGLFGRFKKN